MYLIIWEFRPKKGLEKEFEKVYGPGGDWVEFFRRGEGYLRTTLQRDIENEHRYLTIDEWSSKQAYETFRTSHAQAYGELDRRFEALTEFESQLGSFVLID